MTKHIMSMYWNNIDPAFISAQKSVFRHLGLEVTQHEATGIPHGVWMDNVLSTLSSDDSVLFVDIDCVPLNSSIVDYAFQVAETGRICGSGQTANHLADSQLLYAAPSFLCFSVKLWNVLGRASMSVSLGNDAAMGLTRAAMEHCIDVEIFLPSFVCCPKWPLANKGATGFGTFYRGDIFHLFQSRDNGAYNFAFQYVSDCVLKDRKIDYIDLHRRMNSVATIAKTRYFAALKRLDRVRGSLRRAVGSHV